MKKTKIVLPLLALVCLIFSCSSDDNGGNEPQTNDAVGTWRLTELNINPPQDINMDGNSTGNILDELSCAIGTINISDDGTWDSDIENLSITLVTGDLFIINCAGSVTRNSGTWILQGSQLTLFRGFTSLLFTLQDDTIILSSNEDLPGFRSEVYQRQ